MTGLVITRDEDPALFHVSGPRCEGAARCSIEVTPGDDGVTPEHVTVKVRAWEAERDESFIINGVEYHVSTSHAWPIDPAEKRYPHLRRVHSLPYPKGQPTDAAVRIAGEATRRIAEMFEVTEVMIAEQILADAEIRVAEERRRLDREQAELDRAKKVWWEETARRNTAALRVAYLQRDVATAVSEAV